MISLVSRSPIAGTLQLFEFPSGELVFSYPALRSGHPAPSAPFDPRDYLALRAYGARRAPRVRIISLRLIELLAVVHEHRSPLESFSDISRDDLDFLLR